MAVLPGNVEGCSWKIIDRIIDDYPNLDNQMTEKITTIEWLWVNYLCKKRPGKYNLQVFSSKKALECANSLFDWIKIAEYSKTHRKMAFEEIAKFDIKSEEDVRLLRSSRSLQLTHIGWYLSKKSTPQEEKIWK